MALPFLLTSHCLPIDLPLPFLDLPLPFLDLPLPFIDLSLPFLDYLSLPAYTNVGESDGAHVPT